MTERRKAEKKYENKKKVKRERERETRGGICLRCTRMGAYMYARADVFVSTLSPCTGVGISISIRERVPAQPTADALRTQLSSYKWFSIPFLDFSSPRAPARVSRARTKEITVRAIAAFLRL